MDALPILRAAQLQRPNGQSDGCAHEPESRGLKHNLLVPLARRRRRGGRPSVVGSIHVLFGAIWQRPVDNDCPGTVYIGYASHIVVL